MKYNLVLQGTPKPMQSPRLGRWRTYDPLASHKIACVSQLKQQCTAIGKKLDGALEVSLTFIFTPPASASKKRKEAMIRGDIRHTVKPDADNCTKCCLDILKRCVIVDDALVDGLSIKKRYGEEAMTLIGIEDTVKG